MAAGYPVHDEPPDVEHAGVVVDVEEGDLVIVLPEYEEEGVHELDELGEVVPPQDADDLRGGDATGDGLKETEDFGIRAHDCTVSHSGVVKDDR